MKRFHSNFCQRYLQLTPQLDQYYIRAKLISALLLSYENRLTNGNDLLKFNKLAASDVMTALEIAQNPKNVARYKFLVFNISIIFWRIVHKFLRSVRAKNFAPEIAKVPLVFI